MATPQASPNPLSIFETLGAYQRTSCLNGAIELGLFSAIGEGNKTVAAIAKRIQASEKGTRVLCDFLTVSDFLLKQDGEYSLTPTSAMFLDEKSPAYMGGATRFLSSPQLQSSFNDIAGLVRKGGTLLEGNGTVEDDNPMWIEFARSMAPMMQMPAHMIAGILGAAHGEKWKVLDIAAGHGVFGIAIAEQNPNAEVMALDWEAVLEVAQENAEKRGVARRFQKLVGNAFEVNFGTGYDVVLLTNFLHHFDVVTCEKLLRKVKTALKPGGRVATLEFVPNEDRVSPPIPATFSLMMLGTTPRGDAYTFRELESMFANAGFSRSELHVLPPGAQSLVVSFT